VSGKASYRCEHLKANIYVFSLQLQYGEDYEEIRKTTPST
jgi:hypothetical protein